MKNICYHRNEVSLKNLRKQLEEMAEKQPNNHSYKRITLKKIKRLENLLESTPEFITSGRAYRLRKFLSKRFNNECFYCGTRGSFDNVEFGLDHYIPIKTLRRKNKLSLVKKRKSNKNLVWSCNDCNLSKATLSPEKFANLCAYNVNFTKRRTYAK